MKRRHLLPVSLVFFALLQASHGVAAAPSGDSELCRAAIAKAELAHRIPDAFLAAIAKVESGRPVNGMIVPWPWTINAEGAGSFFATKADAIAAVQALQARGVRSIDVGCMQVNLQQHPEAFRSLDQAFNPVENAQSAAGLLVSLFAQFGSWPLAAAAYHSQTPTIGAAYQRQVLAAWAQPDRPVSGSDKAADRAAPASAPKPSGPGQPPAPAMVASSFGRQSGLLAGEQPHPGALHGTGRGLAAYRETPVRLAFRPVGRSG